MPNGGKREGSGRKKGVPNKFTSDIRGMIIGALNENGGQDWLAKQMKDNPVAFMGLIGKVLPTTLTTDPASPLRIVLTSGVPREEIEGAPLEQANGQHAGH